MQKLKSGHFHLSLELDKGGEEVYVSSDDHGCSGSKKKKNTFNVGRFFFKGKVRR